MKFCTSTALNVLKLSLIIFSGMPHIEKNLLKASKNDFTERSGVNSIWNAPFFLDDHNFWSKSALCNLSQCFDKESYNLI